MSEVIQATTGSEAVTRGIRVEVRAAYSEEHSDPRQGRWFFLYTIRISNEGEDVVQLHSRHWTITDGTGRVEEVVGEGVVGEQPVLQPGESFEYTSGCPLDTPMGSMRGTYQMRLESGTEFDADIGRFELNEPSAIH